MSKPLDQDLDSGLSRWHESKPGAMQHAREAAAGIAAERVWELAREHFDNAQYLGKAELIEFAKSLLSTAPNLADKAVQARLAAQWGYVPATAQQALQVPAGTWLAPMEPTPEMLKAGESEWTLHNPGLPYDTEIPAIYRAMRDAHLSTQPPSCGQVNSGTACDMPRHGDERVCPDCNPRPAAKPPVSALVEALKVARDHVYVRVVNLREAYRGYPQRYAAEEADLALVDAALAAHEAAEAK